MRILALLVLLVLNGCASAIPGAIQGIGAQIGPAVGAIDTDIYAVALAKYRSAQMFKAQLDGTAVLPPLPPPPSVFGPTPPTLTPPNSASPTVPVVGTPPSSPPNGALPTGPTGK